MSHSKSNTIQEVLSNAFSELANSSIKAYQPLMKTMAETYTNAGKQLLKGGYGSIQFPKLFKETCNCCPPDCTCPPHCIAAIERHAMEGERIIVPFTVKNNCSHQTTYKVGVRELKDQDGKTASSQPILNKDSITLEPGQSIRVLMSIDLISLHNGSTYKTEIVLREKDINQNICFTLFVEDTNDVMVEPQEEKKMQMRWQSWRDHYWCEPKKGSVHMKPAEG